MRKGRHFLFMNTKELKTRFEEIFKKSSKDERLENFAMYAKFLVESAGDIFLDDIVGGILDLGNSL